MREWLILGALVVIVLALDEIADYLDQLAERQRLIYAAVLDIREGQAIRGDV